jgi:hypothetical protein
VRPITGTYLLRSKIVYALLAVVWVIIVGWQVAEHDRVKRVAQTALRNRSKDITSILAIIVKSQRFRGGPLFQERLENALKELVRSGEVTSVALLNAQSDVIVAAGDPIHNEIKETLVVGEKWEAKRLLIGNLVDLGASVTTRDGETNAPTIVFPPRTNAPSMASETNRPPSPQNSTNRPPRERGERGERGDRDRGPRFGRPPWMNEADYQNLLQQRGLHGMVLAMSTEPFL